MGLFDVFKKKETKENTTQQSNECNVNIGASTNKINLRKETINKICLEKKELNNLTSRVILALDYSGSMDYEYTSGRVQKLVDRLIPLALKFDDDGDMGVWIFENSYKQLPDMDINNYSTYVKKHILKHNMGGTVYSGVMSDIVKKYTVKEPADIPTYVIFITDGDCFSNDKRLTESIIREASDKNIFWQFVGIGGASFDFLEKLDDMSGRYMDNADFFNVNDIHKMSDEELYKRLLNEYPEWIKQARNKNMIK